MKKKKVLRYYFCLSYMHIRVVGYYYLLLSFIFDPHGDYEHGSGLRTPSDPNVHVSHPLGAEK